MNPVANGKIFTALFTWIGLLLLTLLTSVQAVPQYPGDIFKQISPTVVSRDYISLIEAGSRLVRISYRGDVEISEDQGLTWLNRSPGQLTYLRDIAWTGSRLVAVGNAGRIIGSDDLGVTWQDLPSNASADYYSIAWTGNHLIATGAYSQTSQSADGGNTWDTYYFDLGELNGTTGISNAWISVGTNGVIIGSTDLGETWSIWRPAVPGTAALHDILFTGTEFIGVGENGTILRGTRPDAMVPVTSGTTVKLMNLSKIGTRIFACGGQVHGGSTEPQTLLSSDDGGLTWSPRYTGSVGRARGVVGTAPNLIAVGDSNMVLKSSNGGTTWVPETMAATAPSDNIVTMIEADGLMVGVGSAGLINTSSDGGRTWTTRNSQTTSSFNDILKVGNRLVAVGDEGIVRTSDDNGVTWTPRTSGASGYLFGLAYTGNTLVMVGANSSGTASIVYYSINQGNTWTPGTAPAGNYLFAVEWTGTSLVATGFNGEIMISTDEGRIWSRVNSGSTESYLDVAAGPGYQIAVGNGPTILRSTNHGVTWQPVAKASTITGGINNLLFDGTTWYALGAGGVIYSNDAGMTWAHNRHYIAAESGVMVHDGSSLILVNASFQEVYSSQNSGESWKGIHATVIPSINDITKKGNRYVAVGGTGQIMTSDNGGTDWEIWSGPLLFSDLNDIASTPSGYVAVGASGQLLTSLNGQQWVNRSIPGITADLHGVAYGAGRVVVVGSIGNALVSNNDGSSWTPYPTGLTGPFLEVTYGNGQFVAVGENGVIVTSPNGEVWTQRTSGTTKMLWEVTWTGTRYIAIGGTALDTSGGGIILSSENGITWTTRASDLTDAPNTIAVIGSRLVALGKTMRGISTNGGLNWTISYGSLNWFYTSHWDGKILLAGGANKNLWYSEGNAEGLAALGLIPSVEVRGPDELPLTKGVSIINRPAILIGEVGEPVTLSIRNTGTAPLSSLTVIPSGIAAGDFEIGISTMKLSLDPGEITTFTLRFSPTVAGVRNASLNIGSNDPNDNPFTFGLQGTGLTARAVFDTVMGNNNLTGNNSLPEATPYGDGVSNLLKYAFNLNLSSADNRVMAPMGTSGLPLFRVVETEGVKYWQVEYVRKKSSGLIYVPECSSSIAQGSFTPMLGTPVITPINSSWERVTLSEIYNPTAHPRRFSRIMVRLP